MGRMTTPKQAKEQFLFPSPTINPDANLNFVEIAQTSNINNFSHHVSYLANLVIGGKTKPEDAYQEIKKLYKALKQSHKSLKGSWF
jgi:hypothetical protein